MQQTRVEQGMPYFNRFAEKYPTVDQFASAHEDDILKLWQGLGYYSRGRNMHHTAKVVMEEHSGYFPAKYDKLIKLKGIGEYTAAAISSFASNEAKAVVDGNVFRLLSRYFGIDTPINSSGGKKLFTELANSLIDTSHAGLYNQATMEFGSLQCKPNNPDCSVCPLLTGCFAFKTGRISELPVKIKANKTRERFFNYIIATKDDRILVHKRGPKDIWQNLYEFPLFETGNFVTAQDLADSEHFRSIFGADIILKSVSKPVTHILSHQKLCATFIEIENYSEQFIEKNSWKYVSLEELENLAQPKLIFQFVKTFFKLTNEFND
jgi:A/G-specific adenine glycosylase